MFTRMSFLRRKKVVAPPRPVDPADTANRADQVRRKRLLSGGRLSTFLAQAVDDPGDPVPLPTLTGVPR